MLGGKTCAESLRRRAQDEALAFAHGVETPPVAAVRVNVLRVPASRADDLDGFVAAGGTKGLDCRPHARTVRHLDGTDIGRKAQLLLGRKSGSDHGGPRGAGSRCAQCPGVTPRPVIK